MDKQERIDYIWDQIENNELLTVSDLKDKMPKEIFDDFYKNGDLNERTNWMTFEKISEIPEYAAFEDFHNSKIIKYWGEDYSYDYQAAVWGYQYLEYNGLFYRMLFLDGCV